MSKVSWRLDWQVPKFPKEEGERRHKRIREQMGYRGLHCLIIANSKIDTRYVSGCVRAGVDCILFPFDGDPVTFMLEGQEKDLATVSFIKARKFWPFGGFGFDYASSLVGMIKELGLEKGNLGLVRMRKDFPASLYVSLLKQLPDATFVDASDLIQQIRIIKHPLELEFMRKSGECADKGLEAMRDVAKPGVRELDLAAACVHGMQIHGAEPSDTWLLLSSGNWKYRSGMLRQLPSARVIEKGDVILSEITACHAGYSTQLCGAISIGTPDDDLKRLAEIQLAMYEVGRKELKPSALYEDVEKKIKEAGMKSGKDRFDHNLTWALQTCEQGDADSYIMRDEIKPGMCFVIHPFTVDARIREGSPDYILGHIFGNSFIVTNDGNECLSKLPNEITIV